MLSKTINNLEKFMFFGISGSILGILIYNVFHYDQILGYDGAAHSAYIDNFLNMFWPGRSTRLSAELTYEYFSPPLPYAFPAFINEVCKMYFSSQNIYEDCRVLYSFTNMIFQSILYIFTLLIYMKIIKVFTNNKKFLNINILLLIGIFTANYRTISMLRGETYVILFNSILLYQFLKLFKNSFEYDKSDLILSGFIIGFLALSKQWAFLLFPSYFLLIFLITDKKKRYKYFKYLSAVFALGFIVSSWFYFNLYFDYGTFTAFNKEPVPFSFSNQPLSFYLPVGEEVMMVFTKPIRPYFLNQFFPVLYSDLWGDYWGYFTFTSRALDIGRNQLLIGDYLARVNIFSLIPTLILIIGFKRSFRYFKQRQTNDKNYFIIYIIFSVLVSFFGFMWFLISYPEPSGDTNKATYIIQLFHLLGLLGVVYLEKLKEINKNRYQVITILLYVVFFHNISAMMSHFPLQNQLEVISEFLK